MIRKTCMLLVVALLAGCATYPDVNRQRLESLPQRYSQFDLKVAWEVRQVGNDSFVDGVVQNIRFSYMEDIEVWVAGIDAAGKSGQGSVCYIIPSQLNLGETAAFSVKLPVRVEPGTRLLFTYKYRGNDDGGSDGGGSGNWMQSFEAVVPG